MKIATTQFKSLCHSVTHPKRLALVHSPRDDSAGPTAVFSLSHRSFITYFEHEYLLSLQWLIIA